MPRFDPARLQDTIVAPVTPPGHGGVSVVRLSGSRARQILETIFRPSAPPRAGRSPFRPRRAVLGRLTDPAGGEVVDEGLAVFFPAPHSYTGEDVAELSLHGSPVLVERALAVCRRLGARLAEPGEYTRRAFRNGKMDLCQAEAVRNLTAARTELQARVARRQAGGEAAAAVRPVKEALLDLLVRMETVLEFDEDQGGLGVAARFDEEARELRARLAALEKRFRFAALAENGFSLVLAGRPNAGKSTLFNALLGRERAIVADLPGTTRDTIRESASLYGLPVVLADTAGIRPTEDPLESLSIRRTRQVVADADAVLFVVDGSRPWGPEDEHAREALSGARVVVALSKADLPPACPPDHLGPLFPDSRPIPVSARTGHNLEELRRALYHAILPGSSGSEEEQQGFLPTLRQQGCIRDAAGALDEAAATLGAGHSEEYAVLHLRRALSSLDALTGETAPEEVLDRIFSTFCIGK